MKAITVGLVLEHRMVVDALTAWFDRRAPADIRLVATTITRGNFADMNVVIADRHSLTALTSACSPSKVDETAIVLLVDDLGEQNFDEEGVRAYVAMTDEVEVLTDAIRSAAGSATAQSPFYSPRITDLIAAGPLASAGIPENAVILTVKQRRVLDLYVDGLTGQEIADALGMARNTVRTYIKNIRAKYRTAGFPVRNKIDLLHAARSPMTVTKPRSIRKKPKPDAAIGAEKTRAWDDEDKVLTLPRPAAPSSPPPTLTVTDLSRLFDLDEKIVRTHLTNGTIPAYRIRHHWLIFTAEVRALFNDPENTASPTPDILAGYGATMKPRDLQDLFRLTRQTVNLWLKLGVLPGYRIGARWLIHTHQLRHALTTYSNQSRRPAEAGLAEEDASAPATARTS